MTTRRVWCVFESTLRPVIRSTLEGWGWECFFVPDAGQLLHLKCPDDERLFDGDEATVEDWAYTALKLVEDEAAPLLLIQAEMPPGQRSNAAGLLLAERVWCTRPVPTVLAAVNLRTGSGAGVKRIRSSGAPVLPLRDVLDTSQPQGHELILWDVLSGKDEFDAAVRQADSVAATDTSPISKSLREALLAAQTAELRHRLAGLTASLRIAEGAFRCGWLEAKDVEAVLNSIEKYPRDIPGFAQLLRESRKMMRFPQDEAAPPNKTYSKLHVLVCDDDWSKSGWNILISQLLKRRFGVNTHGFSSTDDLLAWLGTNREEETVTLLLDVDYREDKPSQRGAFRIDAAFIDRIHRSYPLLDVILFTSELEDGVLVRAAYELGYRFFFKEMDEPARKPKVYARKFVDAVERSLKAFPLRALYRCALVNEADADEILKDEPFRALLAVLEMWRDNTYPTVVFNLPPLIEEQFCARYTADVELQLPQRRGARGKLTNQIDLEKAFKNYKQTINLQSEVWALWQSIFPLGRACRNRLVHEANLVLQANSLLPSIGMAVPILVAMSLLYVSHDVDANTSKAVCGRLSRSLTDLCRSILVSGHIQKTQVSELLDQLHSSVNNPASFSRLLASTRQLALANEDLLGKEVSSGSVTDILSRVSNTFTHSSKPPGVTPYHFCVALCALCVLDHADSKV